MANNQYTDEWTNKREKLVEMWGIKNPLFEKRFESSVMRLIATYGEKASTLIESKGKVLGAAYEAYIMAFFIGLYANKRLPLSKDADDLKKLGQPIQFWGNLDSKKNRKAYPQLRNYIFIALVAKTDIDWIALDKGEIKASSVVAKLIETMEEYANYGFVVMEEKLANDPGYFYSNRSFLDIFLQLTEDSCIDVQDEDAEPL